MKVTIDAYDGTTRFHLIDTKDPVAATLARVFPDLFEPLSAMPEDLRTRLRYPQGIFAVQASMFATFHMTNPSTFYNREDQWDVPSLEQGRGEARPMVPYYTIMKLPGETEAEYIQMLPYTPRQKDNLAAWMVARSDGENYGKLMVFQFPKQTVIFGPRQVAARISQDQVIAPQITLWNQQGSEVIQGNLLVIPIEESLLYIRPLYLRAAGGRIPELKRVVVAYQNHIVMEETLDEALDRLFPTSGAQQRETRAQEPSQQRSAESGSATAPPSGPAAEAQQHYQRALEAQRAGDWARYGEEIRQLGEALRRLNAQPQSTAAPTGSARPPRHRHRHRARARRGRGVTCAAARSTVRARCRAAARVAEGAGGGSARRRVPDRAVDAVAGRHLDRASLWAPVQRKPSVADPRLARLVLPAPVFESRWEHKRRVIIKAEILRLGAPRFLRRS